MPTKTTSFVPIRAWMVERDEWPFAVFLTRIGADTAKRLYKAQPGKKRKWSISEVRIVEKS